MENTGTVKQLSERGYGFIARGDDKDLFFHVTGMQVKGTFDSLALGDKVRFTIDNSGDKPRGIEVCKID